jgi:excisionase family DNA binding protein
LLLSKRQAARLLGIGRDTLAKLIAAGHVRMVDLLDREPKISREECERFAREGTGQAPEASTVPLPKRRAAAAVRSLRGEF